MTPLRRIGAMGLALCTGLTLLSACSRRDQADQSALGRAVAAGTAQLVAFDSCADALAGLRTAAKQAVGPYGFIGGGPAAAGGQVGPAAKGDTAMAQPGAPPPGAAEGAGAAEGRSGGAQDSTGTPADPAYSGTTTHEAGVDEPDLVKTDGRRIVTVSGGRLYVASAADRTLTGSADLTSFPGNVGHAPYDAHDMLLAGDHALVLLRPRYPTYRGGVGDQGALPAADPQRIAGPRLVLMSLAGQPRVLSHLVVDGTLLDARQVGQVARVVVRSAPRISFPPVPKLPSPGPPVTGTPGDRADAARVQANQDTIDQVGIEDWLPRIETVTGGATQRRRPGCDHISRPTAYTGANLLTVLTFDLATTDLGDGRPTTLVADGDTVYSNGPSLYVASDQSYLPVALPDGPATASAAERGVTHIYKFDTSTPEGPVFLAGGSVPGKLINQYAMSEWDGHLRVATTVTPVDGVATGQQPSSQSGVTVLARQGKTLTQVGRVDGLGKGERIYAVRFVGPTGYVVTFRQTDPLYTVDLRDPAQPVVRGELKIPGYSAYLHPIADNRLIGVGRAATSQGQVTGTQVSLFTVADLANPTRVAVYTQDSARTTVEYDPHAFLYWPATSLLVIPIQGDGQASGAGGSGVVSAVPGVPAEAPPGDRPASTVVAAEPATGGALVLRIGGSAIEAVGIIRHPRASNPLLGTEILRSLVIDTTLWTVSAQGLLASDLTSLAQQAWVPFA